MEDGMGMFPNAGRRDVLGVSVLYNYALMD